MKEIFMMIILAIIYCTCVALLVIFRQASFLVQFFIGSIIGLLTSLIYLKKNKMR